MPIARAAAGLPAMQATHPHPARAPLHVPANDEKDMRLVSSFYVYVSSH